MIIKFNSNSFINRWISKKFFVWTISTILLVMHYLPPEQWYLISLIYLGGQHAHDALINWKHGPNASFMEESNTNNLQNNLINEDNDEAEAIKPDNQKGE